MGNSSSEPGRRPPPPRRDPLPNPGTQYTRNPKKFSVIPDNYHTLDQVQAALRQAGLESSNLIVGIDFTKSNEWTGKNCFNGRSLHAIGEVRNPYEQTISIIGRTLAVFDEDNLVPCFGFGDASTHDENVFSFYPDHRPCNGFDEALLRYRQIVPNLKLSGPTSFAPIVEAAMRTVEKSGGQYHVLVIVADGQVTRSVDTRHGSLSAQEKATIDAIVRAADYPLSIILVGVGDGPWDMMRAFDDKIPTRAFDNLQFVNFSDIMAQNWPTGRKEAAFALAALMEIPLQYKATMELGLLGRPKGHLPSRNPLPPPQAVVMADQHGFGQAPGQSYPPVDTQAPRPSYPPVGTQAARPSYGPGDPQAARQSYGPGDPQAARQSYGPGDPQAARQSSGPGDPQAARQSYGPGDPQAARQSFGPGDPQAARQSFGPGDPQAARQSYPPVKNYEGSAGLPRRPQ